MPTFRIDQFKGLAPKFDRRQLPAGMAQAATSCRFDSGDIKPFRVAVDVQPTGTGVLPHDTGNLFWYRADEETLFIEFGRNFTVTATNTPVPSDQFKRWYFNIRPTAVDPGGLRAVSNPLLPTPPQSVDSGPAFKRFAGYPVGIPAPSRAPAAVATDEGVESVGSGTSNALTTIARTNPVTINTAQAHTFKAGQRVFIKIDPSLPKPHEAEDDDPVPPDPDDPPEPLEPAIGQVWALDGLEGVVSGVSSNQFQITGINATSFQEFVAEDIAATKIERRIVDADLESRAYVFTYVSDFDEEGPPSPPSNIVDVLKEGVVDVGIFQIAHNPELTGGSLARVNRIRVYRTAAGTAGTLFLFVGTLPFSDDDSDDSNMEWLIPPNAVSPELSWGGTLRDPVTSIELGEPLQSQQWFPPPPGMWGIAMMPNGIIAGWKGNTLHFCEPNLPHAWDPDNRRVLDSDVVGCEVFGTTLVVGTRGRPYFCRGIDPSAMRIQKLDEHAPLLFPHAIADAGFGVVYVADNGLVLATTTGVRLITSKRYNKVTWLEAVAGRDQVEFHDGRVFIFGANREPLALQLAGDDVEPSVLSDENWSCAVRVDNKLAFVTRGNFADFRQIRYFNDGGTRYQALWKSGLITSRQPVNPSIAQVLADGYPVFLGISRINPNSYPIGVPGQPDLGPGQFSYDQYEVKGPEPFRLPATFMSREFEIEMLCQHRVQSILVSTSMDELRAQD